MRADALRDTVGLAMHHAHPAIVDAKRVSADLRHHGLKTLAERGAAGDQLDLARRLDRDANGVTRSEAALLHEHREPCAHRFTSVTARSEARGQRGPIEALE